MTTHMLRERVEALHDDLAAAHPGEVCTEPVARIFNALLTEVRDQLVEDPVVKVIKPIWPINQSTVFPTAAALQVLAGQLRAALGSRTPRAVSARPAAPPVPAGVEK